MNLQTETPAIAVAGTGCRTTGNRGNPSSSCLSFAREASFLSAAAAGTNAVPSLQQAGGETSGLLVGTTVATATAAFQCLNKAFDAPRPVGPQGS